MWRGGERGEQGLRWQRAPAGGRPPTRRHLCRPSRLAASASGVAAFRSDLIHRFTRAQRRRRRAPVPYFSFTSLPSARSSSVFRSPKGSTCAREGWDGAGWGGARGCARGQQRAPQGAGGAWDMVVRARGDRRCCRPRCRHASCTPGCPVQPPWDHRSGVPPQHPTPPTPPPPGRALTSNPASCSIRMPSAKVRRRLFSRN